MNKIDKFSGRYHFLSNFSAAEVWLDGDSYPSVEHAYQAAKTLDSDSRADIQAAPTPNVAKRYGRGVELRDGWEDMKVPVMQDLVRQKFKQHPELADKLLATGNAELIEGNWWGDVIWGRCNGVGANLLGQILMEVRQEIRERIEQGEATHKQGWRDE